MKKLIEFFRKAGGLRTLDRRGWTLIEVEDPATIVDHMYRLALMCWLLSKEKKQPLDLSRLLKITLVHDLCELHAGDKTPYDYADVLPEDPEKRRELFDRWPRFSKEQKEKIAERKHREEEKGIDQITEGLTEEMKKEIKDLWEDYNRGSSREARFVKQVNRLETLLQALEYAEEDENRPFRSWWIGTKERIDDPVLVEFMEALEKSFSFLDHKDSRVLAG